MRVVAVVVTGEGSAPHTGGCPVACRMRSSNPHDGQHTTCKSMRKRQLLQGNRLVRKSSYRRKSYSYYRIDKIKGKSINRCKTENENIFLEELQNMRSE